MGCKPNKLIAQGIALSYDIESNNAPCKSKSISP